MIYHTLTIPCPAQTLTGTLTVTVTLTPTLRPNPNPYPNEDVCCEEGRHWDKISALKCSGTRYSGAGRRPPYTIHHVIYHKQYTNSNIPTFKKVCTFIIMAQVHFKARLGDFIRVNSRSPHLHRRQTTSGTCIYLYRYRCRVSLQREEN